MKARELCLKLIRLHIKRGLSYISSYNQFDACREWKFIDDDVKYSTLLNAMKIGKEEGWLEAWWEAVFPPFAGGATRSRIYSITEKGKKEAFWWREK